MLFVVKHKFFWTAPILELLGPEKVDTYKKLNAAGGGRLYYELLQLSMRILAAQKGEIDERNIAKQALEVLDTFEENDNVSQFFEGRVLLNASRRQIVVVTATVHIAHPVAWRIPWSAAARCMSSVVPPPPTPSK